MATTIAKLAAVVTTDTAQFQGGMRRAGQMVQNFSKENERTTQKMLAVSRSAISASGAFGRLGGVVGGIGAVGGPVGLLVAGLAAATAASGGLLVKMMQIADASRDAKLEAFRDLLKAQDELKGTAFSANLDDLVTAKELVAEMKQSVTDLAEGLGLSLQPLLAIMTQLVNVTVEDIIGADVVLMLRQQREEMQKQIEQAKELRAEKQRLVEEERRAIAAIQSDMEQTTSRLQSRAAALRDSLRTPSESLRDAVLELKKLRDAGFINEETLGRGIKRAADDYNEAAKRLIEAKNTLRPTAALERGTIAEFSARVNSRLETARLEALAAEQVKAAKATTAELVKLNAKPPVKLTKGAL